MKLLDDFFQIKSCGEKPGAFEFVLQLNPGHLIYKGHFPGHPVTPGVIQLQIVQELLEFKLNRKLVPASIAQVKFLNILNPEKETELMVIINYVNIGNSYTVNAIGKTDLNTIFKSASSFNL